MTNWFVLLETKDEDLQVASVFMMWRNMKQYPPQKYFLSFTKKDLISLCLRAKKKKTIFHFSFS